METRKIGSLTVSVVGMGTNNFGRRLDADATKRVVDAAVASGITFFDTAASYGNGLSEEYLGRALGSRRQDVIIATKFGSPSEAEGASGKPDYVRRAVETSLRHLGSDYIDLYILHRPDANTPIAETLGALNELVRAGKVREIACCNFSVEQLRAAEEGVQPGAARFVAVQNEYSLFKREPENGVLAECERTGLAFIPYFPLASGLLTGKYRPGEPAPEGSRLAGNANQLTEENLQRVAALTQYAEAHGHTILELAISWLLSHDVVASVIAGATRPEQAQANAAAANWQLSAAELAEIDQI